MTRALSTRGAATGLCTTEDTTENLVRSRTVDAALRTTRQFIDS